MAKFEIKNMRQVNGCGTLKATFTAAFTALELNDCKLIEGRDGLFFSPPSRSYDKDGQKKYANYFYFTDEGLRREIEDAAKGEYAKIAGRSSQGQQRSEEPPFDPHGDIPF